MGISREGVNMNKLELIKEREEMIKKMKKEIDINGLKWKIRGKII